MASPAWFFSTLAQASAAIIAFTIAFTVTSYSTRREYIQDRTDKFRDKLIRYQEKYLGVMDNMARELRQSIDIDYDNTRFDLIADDPTQWAETQTNPEAARLWAYISGVSNILSEVDPALGPEISDDQLGELNVAGRHMPHILAADSAEDVYQDISDTSSLPDDLMFTDVFDEGRWVEAWLSRNLTERFENQVGTAPGDMPLSGRNFYSWTLLLEEFRRDTKLLTGRTPATEITDFMSPGFAGRVMITSLKLAILGVFVPILFLISSPSATFPAMVVDFYSKFPSWPISWSIYLLEAILLFASGFYTLQLFLLMIGQLDYQPASTMAELLGADEESEENN